MNIKNLLTEIIFSGISVGNSNDSNRVEWIKKTLSKIPTGSSILDAGAGELRFKPFCNHLQYTSQDFGGYDGKGDDLGLQTKTWDQTRLDITCDIINIPVPDSSFDAILCVEVFEHIPDPALAIKEFSRICKSGGTVIITAPFCSLTHFAPFHFATGFNRYYYKHHLEKSGFVIEEIVPNGNFHEYLAQEIHRLPTIIRTYQEKQPNFLSKIYTMILSSLLLRQLETFSKTGNSSSELLCHGYHVVAKKI